eukprot:749020-Hanusia_phi.AAC.2
MRPHAADDQFVLQTSREAPAQAKRSCQHPQPLHPPVHLIPVPSPTLALLAHTPPLRHSLPCSSSRPLLLPLISLVALFARASRLPRWAEADLRRHLNRGRRGLRAGRAHERGARLGRSSIGEGGRGGDLVFSVEVEAFVSLDWAVGMDLVVA